MFCSQCGTKNQEDYNFCSHCGEKNNLKPCNRHIEELSLEDEIKQKIATLKEISSAIHITINGDSSGSISSLIAQSIGVKRLDQVVFNTYASNEFFIILPISKDKSNIVMLGLLLGSGGLAGAAMGALGGIAKKLEAKQGKSLFEQDYPFSNAIVFRKSELTLKVKETRSSNIGLMELFMKETWMLVSGKATYKKREYQIGIQFGYEGQSSDPSKKKLLVLENLVEALGIQKPPIHVGKNPPF